jgi:hypothetical protein
LDENTQWNEPSIDQVIYSMRNSQISPSSRVLIYILLMEDKFPAYKFKNRRILQAVSTRILENNFLAQNSMIFLLNENIKKFYEHREQA